MSIRWGMWVETLRGLEVTGDVQVLAVTFTTTAPGLRRSTRGTLSSDPVCASCTALWSKVSSQVLGEYQIFWQLGSQGAWLWGGGDSRAGTSGNSDKEFWEQVRFPD